jgi:hypothetical protein
VQAAEHLRLGRPIEQLAVAATAGGSGEPVALQPHSDAKVDFAELTRRLQLLFAMRPGRMDSDTQTARDARPGIVFACVSACIRGSKWGTFVHGSVLSKHGSVGSLPSSRYHPLCVHFALSWCFKYSQVCVVVMLWLDAG